MISITTDNCKECGLCMEYCPRKALCFGETVNGKGYHAVIVDQDKCNGCGTCYLVCPDFVFNIGEEAAS